MIKSLLPRFFASTLVMAACAMAPTLMQAQEANQEMVVEISKPNGKWTATNPNGTWASTWTSTSSEPQLRLSTGQNNMDYYDGGAYVRMFTGTALTCDYSLSVSPGYMIVSYSFNFTSDAEGKMIAVSATGVPAVSTSSSTEAKHFSVEGVRQPTTTFTVSNPNKSETNFARTTNFKVVITKDPNYVAQANLFVTATTAATPYRIPAIGVTGRSGALVAVADYRFSRKDIGHGRIDLHVSRSEDNGQTWTPATDLVGKDGAPVAKGNDGMERSSAFGDAAIVGDSQSDSLLLLSVSGRVPFFNGTRQNPNPVARWYSPDGGKTWTQHEDITEQIYSLFDGKVPLGFIDSMFFGSGRIFQSSTVKVGSHYRLYAALSGLTQSNRNVAVWVLYSDDFGQTWNVLGDPATPPIASGGDEPKVEELPNGSILVSGRTSSGRNLNIYHFSNVAKAEGIWGQKALSSATVNGIKASSNACNGEVLIVPVKRTSDNAQMFLLLQSVPFGPSNRSNVGINYKELADYSDYGNPANIAKDWDGQFLVTPMGSAYSTMVLQQDHKVGFLYEEETFASSSGGGYTIPYKAFNISTITNGTYEYDGTVKHPEVAQNRPTEQDLVKAEQLLAHTGLGYPKADAPARTALAEAVAQMRATGDVDLAIFEAKIGAFYAETQVTLPTADRRYNIILNGADGNKYYLDYNGTKLVIKPLANETLSASAAFKVVADENGKLALQTEDGKFLRNPSPSAGVNWLRDESTTGVSDEYDAEMNAINFVHAVQGDKVLTTNDKLLGMFTFQSPRGHRSDNGKLEMGYWVVNTTDTDFSGASVPFYQGKHSSVFTLNPVVMPFGKTVKQLSEIEPNKAYMMYNPHFTTYAIKKPGTDNLWVANMIGDNGHKLSNTEFSLPVDTLSEYAAWQFITDKKGNHYLWNIGAKQFLQTPNQQGSVPCTLNEQQMPIRVVQLTEGLAFSTSGNRTDYCCAAPQLSDKPVSVWTSDDAGSQWFFVENPNITPDQLNLIITKIEQLDTERPSDNSVYTLSGVRMPNGAILPAGVYIVNGKKHIVR